MNIALGRAEFQSVRDSIFRIAVSPQWLKPTLKNQPVIAAVNRCATQNQTQHHIMHRV